MQGVLPRMAVQLNRERQMNGTKIAEDFRVPAREPDRERIPYQLPKAVHGLPDLFGKGALELDCPRDDWVAQGEGVSFKPLMFSPASGQYVNLLRVTKSGVLSRHRHFGTVHAFVLRGSWHYLEHDWIAEVGDYVCEPPGETHTLVVPDEVEEMITLFHVNGGYTYVDPFGTAVGYEDVFTKIDLARAHFESVGKDADYVQNLIR